MIKNYLSSEPLANRLLVPDALC